MNNKFLLLEQKAKKGSVVAQHNLAYEYHKNHENKKAIYWWKKAALNGNYSKAYFNLGSVYYHGWGVPIDYSKSLKYFLKSIKTKHSLIKYSYHAIGGMYYSGEGTKKNISKAIKFYQLAVKQNNIPSMGMLESIYQSKKNKKYYNSRKAFKYELIMAKNNIARSQFKVGLRYLLGKGVRKNIFLADKYLVRALFNKRKTFYDEPGNNMYKLLKLKDTERLLIQKLYREKWVYNPLLLEHLNKYLN
jgi:TPR repeat protein